MMQLRTYPTKESCENACFRSPVRRTPVKLKNGRWAAMTWDEKQEYERRFGKRLTSVKMCR